VDSYRAAEQLLADGRVRAIGVCNHSAEHLRRLVDRTGVVPAVNQVELHPYFTQRELREAGAGLGVVTQSWSPLGGVNTYWEGGRSADKNPLDHPAVHAVAARHGRTPAQVVLRWHLDHGLATIPKSVRPHRIAENFDVFGFSLSAEEVASIDAIDSGVRGGPDPDAVDLDTWT
jgi:diketogulonate reductase-like aldo/keto reductase